MTSLSMSELEADGETVKHVEKVKTEVVLGDSYDVWDVITDKGAWWVITNLTNLYPTKRLTSSRCVSTIHIVRAITVSLGNSRVKRSIPVFDR